MYFRRIPLDTWLYRALVLSSLGRRREPAAPRTAAGWAELRGRRKAEVAARREAGERAARHFQEAGRGFIEAAVMFGVACAVGWLGTLA